MTMPSYKDDYLATLDRPVKLRNCDCPGCGEPGDFRAPKNRALTNYYFFCLTHVRKYNAEWNYFAGMSGAEVEAYTRRATVWERPSWPMGDWHAREQQIRDTVDREFFEDGESKAANDSAPPMPALERDALAALELSAPVTFSAIKAQYRLLVKRWHPDLHGGSREAEERFKSINQAFAVLRGIYGTETAAQS